MTLIDKYRQVIAWTREVSLLGGVSELLGWDLQVNLPKKGFERRGDQLALLDGMRHRRLTEPTMAAIVSELADRAAELDADAQINLREIKRVVDRATKVPPELVEEISRATSQAQGVWVEARRAGDWAAFAPHLQKIVDLRKQEAAALGFGANPYDAMLDHHEPFATEASIRALLEDLRSRLVPFLQIILGAKRYDASAVVGRQYPIDKQRAFGDLVIRRLGFDFDGGRVDVSAHPFCTGTRGDVRITTRFFTDDPRPCLFGMIHEAGHAMYEQGLPEEHWGTPLGEAVSLGVHESQSRFWENIIGRSLPMWRQFYGDLKKTFPGLGDVPLETFHRCVNVVAPSLIRVEADEVTYNLHIILRFEIERALVAGDLSVADLPAAWEAKVKEYLAIDVPNVAQGALQDVHWSLGSLGYFHTYTIGTLYAAQLWDRIRADLGDADALIARGEFAPLLDWLRRNIHAHGKRWRGEELIERATGAKPSAAPFMNYLAEKFGPLYGV